MQYYYDNLKNVINDENSITEEQRKNRVYALRRTAEDTFGPFEEYLNNAIRALKDMQHVKAEWRKVGCDNIAQLRLVGNFYEIPKESTIYFDEGLPEDILRDGIICGSWGVHKVIKILTKHEVVLSPLPREKEMMFIEGNPVQYSVEVPDLSNKNIYKETATHYIVYSESPSTFKQISEKISFENEVLYLPDGSTLDAYDYDNDKCRLADINDFGKTVTSSKGVRFVLQKMQNRYDAEAFWIELSEIDDSDDEDIIGFSPLKYFFEEDIQIVDESKNKYSVFKGNESENKLILKNEQGKYSFPKSGLLTVVVNTYQLEMQKKAIEALKKTPIKEQANLIKLFNKTEFTNWPTFYKQAIMPDEWIVLTDSRRDGCTEQRDFVEKALATPDFAILEGPPGSGKTTVILELICQAIKRGNRVLLCGSTHVAIDNVLERLKENRNGSSLLDRLNILPIRIGDRQRINEDVQEFQIDNILEGNSLYEPLILDAANLVCGTTIGILQHPNFKAQIMNPRIPKVPDFDYLIIDESSKTTFQEFLVPALFAKKWILAGDVKQLSPFTSRTEIESNFSNIRFGGSNGKLVPDGLKQAAFYLQKIQSLHGHGNNKFAFVVDSETIGYIYDELVAGRLENFHAPYNIFYFIDDDIENKSDNEFIKVIQPDSCHKLELVAADYIFVNASIDCSNIIPETHAIIGLRGWESTAHAFKHNTRYRYNYEYKCRGKIYKDFSFDIVDHFNDYFKEKNWSKEISWRIDREHQLRQTVGNRSKCNYTNQIQDLIPISMGSSVIEDEINRIASMAFPSILESLDTGIAGRKTQNKTTISDGFNIIDKQRRTTVLKYQHRMHPDISRFPREAFYSSLDNIGSSQALLDLTGIEGKRSWGYHLYPTRSIWLNVDGHCHRNANSAEVTTIMKELRSFVNYAKNNPHPENGTNEWTIACLTFYLGQTKLLREELRKFTGKESASSNFYIAGNAGARIHIKLYTVDKFQGHEADVVFLSMVQTNRVGFMDNPNRLNVAITRAKYQLVIVGKHSYFANQGDSQELSNLANNTFTQQAIR